MQSTQRKIRGSALVEFALVLPLLIFMITSMMDLARYYFIEQSMSHTTRAAARVAITGKVDENPDYDPLIPSSEEYLSRRQTIIKAARDNNPAGLNIISDEDGAEPTDNLIINPEDGGGGGDDVTITLRHQFTFCTPLIDHILHDKGHPGIFTIEVSTTYRNEVFDED